MMYEIVCMYLDICTNFLYVLNKSERWKVNGF